MKKFFFTVTLALSAGAAQAASVHLKDGGRLEGALVSSTDVEVVLDAAQGRVRIDMNRVRNIDYAPGDSPAPALPSAAARQHMLSFDFALDAPIRGVNLFGPDVGGSANKGVEGSAVGFQYLYFPTPRIGWGLEFDYFGRSAYDSPNLLASAESQAFADTSLLLGVAKYSLATRGPVRPFVVLGAGAHRTTITVDSHPAPGFVWSDTMTDETRRLVDSSVVGFAATARLGLDFKLFDPSVFSLEAGWTGLARASYQATPEGKALGIAGVTGALTYFTFSGRWGFDF